MRALPLSSWRTDRLLIKTITVCVAVTRAEPVRRTAVGQMDFSALTSICVALSLHTGLPHMILPGGNESEG